MSLEETKAKYGVAANREDVHIETIALLREIRDELRILNGKA